MSAPSSAAGISRHSSPSDARIRTHGASGANRAVGRNATRERASGTRQRREIAALFCDLRGFTGFTEIADAEDVMALLRDYHAVIGETAIKYSGTLERYAGDGVMVIFNDPVPVENQRSRLCSWPSKCARPWEH
jgi:class 3 adenylate cyclase